LAKAKVLPRRGVKRKRNIIVAPAKMTGGSQQGKREFSRPLDIPRWR